MQNISEDRIRRVVLEAVDRNAADAVHYGPHEGSHKSFKIHKVGANFQKHVKVGDVVQSSEIDDLADAGAKLKQVKAMKEDIELSEMHADAVHYGPHEGSHKSFKIHKVGSNFTKHVKPGDVVKSSEIDDLADAGAKLKQVKAVKEEAVIQEAAKKRSAAAAYSELHSELGEHIKKLQQLHKAKDPAKVQAAQKHIGRDIDWGHVGDMHSHLETIKRITQPEK